MKNGLDFLKIFDKKSKLIGVVNFNNMIPVDESVITPVDLIIKKTDTQSLQYYKGLLNDQLDWCNDNIDRIQSKAQKLYEIVNKPNRSTSLQLLKRCCKFKLLERELDKFIGNYHYFKTDARGIEQLKSIDAQIEIRIAKEKGYYIVRTIASDATIVANALKQPIPKNNLIKK